MDPPDMDILVHLGNMLSEKECQIMELVAKGLTRGEVAEEMNTSRSSVDRAVRRVQTVMGAANTTAAAVRLMAVGLIDPCGE